MVIAFTWSWEAFVAGLVGGIVVLLIWSLK